MNLESDLTKNLKLEMKLLREWKEEIESMLPIVLTELKVKA